MATRLLRLAGFCHLTVAWLTGSRHWRLLFDPAYYRSKIPCRNPALHFIFCGRFCDISPHPLFDAACYRKRNPDTAAAGWEPFTHFFRAGFRESRSFHPLFDCAYYSSRAPEHAAAPLTGYLETAPDRRLSPHPLYDDAWMRLQTGRPVPIEEYLTDSALWALSPHPLFDPAFYGPCGDRPPLLDYLSRAENARRSTHLLFDAPFYLDTNPDVTAPALLHYVQTGSRESRNPHPLFDTAAYRQNNPEVAASGIDPLVHFLLEGGRKGLAPHPLFDSAFYLETNPDVAAAGINPLMHFLSGGAAEGRNPNPAFDTAFYRQSITGAINPLLHYVLSGRNEGRPTLPDAARYLPVRRPGSPVDVIVPVYGGRDETMACIGSLVACRARNVPHEIIVIDDCSSDTMLDAQLREYAGAGAITLLRNERNTGFTGTANRGMQLHPGRDVVLLNSDTVVAGDWLTRLQAAAWSDGRNGTVTPFTNNGSICSYPRPLEDNPFRPEETAALDAIFREANAGRTHEIPTAVGFCMYIRRDCLETTGLFDEDEFGRGYGEENDFCRRAAAGGWRHILAADVFVYHRGEVSFSDTAPERKQSAFDRMCRLHPDYSRLIADHIRRDPAAPSRTAAAVLGLRKSGGAKHALRVEPVSAGAIRVVSTDPAWPISVVLAPAGAVRLLRECGAAGVTVAALLSRDPKARFDPCAYIRALLPFGHDSVNDLVHLVPIGSAGELTDDFDAVLVQRTAVADEASAGTILRWAAVSGRRLIYETDDNLPAISETHPDWTEYRDKLSPAAALIEQADTVLVSTDQLAAAMSGWNECVVTLPNALDERLWLPCRNGEPPPGTVRALYMGTMTHGQDLELIREAVVRLSREADFRLEVVGVTAAPEGGWYDWLPVPPEVASSYPRFVAWLREQNRWHFGVAPLARSIFNDTKSHLKYLDYAALGLPGVFSASPAYLGVVRHGVSGILAGDSSEEWYRCLSQMVRDADARSRMAAEAMADLQANHTLAAQREMRRRVCGQVFVTMSTICERTS